MHPIFDEVKNSENQKPKTKQRKKSFFFALLSNELGDTQNEAPNININTEAQRYRVLIILCVSVLYF